MDRPVVTERLAAVAALLTLAAAAGVLAAGLSRDWQGVLLALVGLFLLVTSAWSVVARRGRARGIGLTVAVASGGLLIWGILISRPSLWWAGVIIVLAAASVACARFALRGVASARQQARAAQPVRRARHPVLIMNPKSGGGKVERYHLVDECRARGIEPVVLQPGDDLLRVAADAVARGADVIGMAGGDGSQAVVASVAAWHSIPHVVVPAGTRNHFALDLGLDPDDVVAALAAFTHGIERRVDLADVNGRIFVNNASLGLYAKIDQSPTYWDAKFTTAASLLPCLPGLDTGQLDLRFTGPDDCEYRGHHLILVSNDPYQLDDVSGRGTRARLDFGSLGVIAAQIPGAATARQFAALETAGQVRRCAGWLEWETNRFEVNSDGPVKVALDGESLTMDPPLLFTARHAVLRVWLPRHPPGTSSAAKAMHVLSRATARELAATAAGTAPSDRANWS